LATTPADRLLVVDGASGPNPLPEPGFAGVADAVAAQSRFVPVARFDVPEQGAVVTVLARREAVAAPAGAAPDTPNPARRD
ncbi:hypothetical protein, partial [Rhodoplanes roseus]